jgi:hypothetical protein
MKTHIFLPSLREGLEKSGLFFPNIIIRLQERKKQAIYARFLKKLFF